MSNFSSTNVPKSLHGCCQSLYPSVCIDTGDCCNPWYRTLHFAELNFMRFTQTHSSSLSRSLLAISLPSRESTAPLNSVSSRNLLRGYAIPLSLIKILNGVCHCMNTFSIDTGPLAIRHWMWSSSQFPILLTVHPWNPYLSNWAVRMLWGP